MAAKKTSKRRARRGLSSGARTLSSPLAGPDTEVRAPKTLLTGLANLPPRVQPGTAHDVRALYKQLREQIQLAREARNDDSFFRRMIRCIQTYGAVAHVAPPGDASVVQSFQDKLEPMIESLATRCRGRWVEMWKGTKT